MISFFRKGFPLLVVSLVLVAIVVSYGVVFANKYDDDEAIRRAAERLVEFDRQQREAARQRYDEAEARKNKLENEPNKNVSNAIIVVFAIVFIIFLWKRKN